MENCDWRGFLRSFADRRDGSSPALSRILCRPGTHRAPGRNARRRDPLLPHLNTVGYHSTDVVEMPGEYALRGGILDVYSPEAERPVRIEFFGDEVESIRKFDPATQRSSNPRRTKRCCCRLTETPVSEEVAGRGSCPPFRKAHYRQRGNHRAGGAGRRSDCVSRMGVLCPGGRRERTPFSICYRAPWSGR